MGQFQQPAHVAPEGGWGYCVMAGMSICQILTLGILPCLGLLFSDFLRDLGSGTQAIASITSTYFLAASIAGLFLRPLLQRFTRRSTGIAVALIFTTGSFLTAYVTTVVQLVVSFGVMQGIGFGILSTISFATFNDYFVKRRLLMMGIAQTFVCVGSMQLPLLLVEMRELLGHRGCLLVLAALNSNVVVGMLVMQPVEWYVGRKQVNVADVEGTLLENVKKHEPVVSTEDAGLSASLVSKKSNSSKSVAAESVERHSKKSIWRAISDYMDLGLLCDLVYMNISIGMSVALFSDILFFTFQPMYLFNLGYESKEVAQIIAVGAASDLVARFTLGVSTFCVKARARSIFFAGAWATIAVRLVFPYVTDFLAMCAITCVLGFIRASLHVPIALTIADHLPTERFPSGQGLFMFLQGIFMIVLGLSVGRIHTMTGSYSILFTFLNVAMAMCAIPWSIEFLMGARCWKSK